MKTSRVGIYAREVEEVILELPGVAEVAVIGVSDPYWGESVHAIIVPAAGRIAEPGRVIQHCRGSLASYKKTKTIQIVDELPKTPPATSSSVCAAAFPRPPAGPVMKIRAMRSLASGLRSRVSR